MKKIPILLFSLFSFFFILGAKEEAVKITIPVIPSSGKIISEIPDISTLRLTINNTGRKISGLKRVERSLGIKPDLGRNFILSFNMSEYSENIHKGISYFVTEILDPEDSLLVLSPLKFYRIEVSANKEKILSVISELLDKDCILYKREKLSFEKSIKNELAGIRSALADRSRSSAFRVRRYKKIIGFLNYFPEEFKRYLKLSMVLNLSKLRSVKNLIGVREGERWWVHFYRDETEEIISSISRVVREIEKFGMDSGDFFEQDHPPNLKGLTKLLYSTDFFPVKEFEIGLLSNGICFNFVQFSKADGNDSPGRMKKKSLYKKIFNNVSSYSGGTFFQSSDIEKGLKGIRDHKFISYELQFPFNGREEEKQILLTDSKNNKNRFRYREIIEKKDLKQIVKYIRLEKCSIDDFRFKKNSAIFSIKNFKLEMKGKFGLLKVRITLSVPGREIVYSKENTLRASGKRISLKIPFPKRFSGKFMLNINVMDLILNRKTEYSGNVEIR